MRITCYVVCMANSRAYIYYTELKQPRFHCPIKSKRASKLKHAATTVTDVNVTAGRGRTTLCDGKGLGPLVDGCRDSRHETAALEFPRYSSPTRASIGYVWSPLGTRVEGEREQGGRAGIGMATDLKPTVKCLQICTHEINNKKCIGTYPVTSIIFYPYPLSTGATNPCVYHGHIITHIYISSIYIHIFIHI